MSKIYYDFLYLEWKILELVVEVVFKLIIFLLLRIKSYEIEFWDMLYKIIKLWKFVSLGWWGCCGNKYDDLIEKIDLLKYVLNWINMKVRLGEIFGVVGLSGVGKFMFLEVLVCEFRLSSCLSSMLVN